MECANTLGQHIVGYDVIFRIMLLGIVIAIAMFCGYWAIDRVGQKQEKENNDYIKYLLDTIRSLRGIEDAGIDR